MIRAADVERYRRDGYLIFPEPLDRALVDRLVGATDRLIEQGRGLAASDAIYVTDDDHTPERPKLRRIKSPHLLDPAYDEASRHPAILAALELLLGPDIRRDATKINIKHPRTGSGIGWHQDWAFLPHTNDDLLTLSIFLDDCDDENGPIVALPGTHTGDVLPHFEGGFFTGELPEATRRFEAHPRAELRGPRGTVAVHHTRVVHGSQPNRSARFRRILLIRYSAADAWPLFGTLGYPEGLSLEDLQRKIVRGAQTTRPRLAPVPVQIPLPQRAFHDTIYGYQAVTTAEG